MGICQVWLRMSQGREITQRQYCAKYLMFSSYLNLIRPPGGRTISIFFFFLKVANRLRSDKFAGATKTKHHRMGDLTGIYFSHFGRLNIQDQGAIRVDFILRLLWLTDGSHLAECSRGLLFVQEQGWGWVGGRQQGLVSLPVRILSPRVRVPPLELHLTLLPWRRHV